MALLFQIPTWYSGRSVLCFLSQPFEQMHEHNRPQPSLAIAGEYVHMSPIYRASDFENALEQRTCAFLPKALTAH